METIEQGSADRNSSCRVGLFKRICKTVILVGLDNAESILGATLIPVMSTRLSGAVAEVVGLEPDGWVLSRMITKTGVDGIIQGGINVIKKSGAKFALRKGLPQEEEKVLAIENEPHALDGFDGEIESGYGKGIKRIIYKGPAVLKVKGEQNITEVEYHRHDADRAGVHYDFAIAGLPSKTPQFEVNIGRGAAKGRYAFIQTARGYIVQQMKDRGLSIPKPEYKLKAEEILPTLNSSDYVVERKVDGSLANILIREDRAIIHSHRESARSYYDKLPGLEFLENKSSWFLSRWFFPSPLLNNSILKGELVHKDGMSVVAGILNSSADKAQVAQQKIGPVTMELWDIVKLRGKDVSSLPYGERRLLLEEVASDIRLFNKNYHVVDKCPEGESFVSFYSSVLSDSRGLPWSEGIVIKDKNSLSTDPWWKIKRHDLHDMTIIGYQEGTGKYVGSLGALVAKEINTGKSVEVGTGYKDFERSWIWQNRDILGVGKSVIKVKVFKETNDSFHAPRFVEFHESKGSDVGLSMYSDQLSTM